MSAHNRRSVAGSMGSSSHPCNVRHSGSSHSRERPPISRERTAFCRAASKERSMLMTSPVAFMAVPRVRSPVGNLSKGQRGILTTQ